ncbi:MAG: TPM domain-containing protein [Syntrophaceae bacterium]|nr:TPM domain-containing protein [Syntrophaceae bacterium]
MRHTLTNEERSQLEHHVETAEARTGTQIVLSVIERSDNYAELPWKSFALGASLTGFVFFIINLLWPLKSSVVAAFLAIVMILAAGAVFALLCVFVPDFARLFLSSRRADEETHQYAESIFLSRQLFATRERKAVLLLVSLFERRIVVLPDSGLKSQLNREAIDTVIHNMRGYLKAGQTARALDTGLVKLEEFLSGKTPPELSLNELSNDIIEEKGA